MRVLRFLQGRPWDEIALAWVHALRPSMIRVVRGEETLDAVCWRVSVYLGAGGLIQSVRQEVEVGLPEGVEDGHDLRVKTRIDV